jgi:flagellar hook-associated protein 3 FlgL
VSSLQEVTNLLAQAKSIAIEASNSANDATAFDGLATQVNAIFNQVLAIANTQNNGTYSFGGTASSAPPFVVSSKDAQGNPQAVQYQGSRAGASAIIGDNQQVQLYYAGNSVFQGGQPPADTFQSLITLRNLLNNTTNLSGADQLQAISSQIGSLDSANQQVLDQLGQQSASVQTLSSLQSHLQDLHLATQKTISTQGNADLTDVVVKLQTYQNLLQMSLLSFSRITSTSLLNYLPP